MNTTNSICYICKENKDLQDNGCCRQCNKDRSLKYYYANKDRLNRIVKCEACYHKMLRPNYYAHSKTKEHLKLMESMGKDYYFLNGK